MPIDGLYSSDKDLIIKHAASLCESSIKWRWDGVQFSFLHPGKSPGFNDNDRSCVLKIDTAGGSILLTGDIHKRAERFLLKYQSDSLSADILVAPHHGSNTSSHYDFIEAVNPKYVLFGSAYRSRFGHPHPYVLKRYQELSSISLSSADNGAIQFVLSPEKGLSEPLSYRQSKRRHWNRQIN